VEIRPAQPADVEAIESLAERAFALYIERIGRRPAPMDDDYAAKVSPDHAFVATDAGATVGFLLLSHEPGRLLVETVAVDPDRQGEGIGRALLAHAEELARESGVTELRLYTNAKMTENLEFYPRLGYEEIGRGSRNGFERVLFAKQIAG
jgi:ribosomal protein S18 acetylase RimI-like enzyme